MFYLFCELAFLPSIKQTMISYQGNSMGRQHFSSSFKMADWCLSLIAFVYADVNCPTSPSLIIKINEK